ncbi:MAG: transporter permease [Mycobacterium sp.]|nr:transporter permease [Mycobacterium sp.]
MPIALLVVWQLTVAGGVFSAGQLPPPVDVVSALGELTSRGELWTHLGTSLSRVLAGYLSGALAGLALGSRGCRCYCCGSASGRSRRSC